MVQRINVGRRVFVAFNYTFLIGLSLLCLAPLIHILAVSFSSSWAASAGEVTFWPVDFTTSSYKFISNKPEFLQSMIVTLKRVALGLVINLFLTVLTAYPLSKETSSFKWRTLYVWIFVFTILFGGGLIPWYMTVKQTGLLNTIWALVIPGAVPVFNIILLLNFFRGLPKELEEAALIDGAGHWTILWRLFVPLSMPALATISLFTVVGHWNAWFDGMILMRSTSDYPLQTYLRSVIISQDFANLSSTSLSELKEISDRTAKAAQIFLGALPILLVYPFLQRFFIKGIVLGSVKG
ncbi:MAG: transporter permease [Paenibacillus sp.]|jgi:putative aldouronate transport system permease protein|nr:transporter permease [Paenibacillus sp.]